VTALLCEAMRHATKYSYLIYALQMNDDVSILKQMARYGENRLKKKLTFSLQLEEQQIDRAHFTTHMDKLLDVKRLEEKLQNEGSEIVIEVEKVIENLFAGGDIDDEAN
jgi:hypothetical protein